MITIKPYDNSFEKAIIPMIADFFELHSSFVNTSPEESKVDLQEAEEDCKVTLKDWQVGSSELFCVLSKDEMVGFLRIDYRGPIVAWIEDIYVLPETRGKGIGTEIIEKAEDIVKSKEGYEAICLDVVLRNQKAIELYHRLGFTDISMMTLRKEFGRSKRDKDISLLGLDFKY